MCLWDASEQEMHKVPPVYIGIALIPALMIAILYYFDHCVSAQLAQQKEFNLVKPPSYHYDLLLLSVMVSFVREATASSVHFKDACLRLLCVYVPGRGHWSFLQ